MANEELLFKWTLVDGVSAELIEKLNTLSARFKHMHDVASELGDTKSLKTMQQAMEVLSKGAESAFRSLKKASTEKQRLEQLSSDVRTKGTKPTGEDARFTVLRTIRDASGEKQVLDRRLTVGRIEKDITEQVKKQRDAVDILIASRKRALQLTREDARLQKLLTSDAADLARAKIALLGRTPSSRVRGPETGGLDIQGIVAEEKARLIARREHLQELQRQARDVLHAGAPGIAEDAQRQQQLQQNLAAATEREIRANQRLEQVENSVQAIVGKRLKDKKALAELSEGEVRALKAAGLDTALTSALRQRGTARANRENIERNLGAVEEKLARREIAGGASESGTVGAIRKELSDIELTLGRIGGADNPIARLQAAFPELGEAIAVAVRQLDRFYTRLKAGQSLTPNQRAALQQISSNVEDYAKAVEDVRSSQEQTIVDQGEQITGGLSKFQDTVIGAFHGFGRRFRATLQFAISGSLLFGIQRFLREFLKAAIEVERTFADIETALEYDPSAAGGPAPTRGSDAFIKKVDDIRFQVLDLAREFNTLPTIANQVAFQMVARFDKVSNAMKATRAQMLALKISTIDMQETMRALTAVAQTFGLAFSTIADSTDRQTKQADIYARALDGATIIQQKFGITVEDTLEGTAQFAEIARSLNLTLEETEAAVALVSERTGQTGQAVGERLGRVFAEITSEQVVTDLLRLAEASDVLNLSLANFETGGVAIRSLDSQMEELRRLEPDTFKRVIEITGGRREGAMIGAFFGTSEERAEAVRSMVDGVGAAERRFDFLRSTMSELLERVKTGLQEVALVISDLGLLSPLKILLQGMTLALNLANDLGRIFIQIKRVLDSIKIPFTDTGIATFGVVLASGLVTLKGIKSVFNGLVKSQVALSASGGLGKALGFLGLGDLLGGVTNQAAATQAQTAGRVSDVVAAGIVADQVKQQNKLIASGSILVRTWSSVAAAASKYLVTPFRDLVIPAFALLTAQITRFYAFVTGSAIVGTSAAVTASTTATGIAAAGVALNLGRLALGLSAVSLAIFGVTKVIPAFIAVLGDGRDAAAGQTRAGLLTKRDGPGFGLSSSALAAEEQRFYDRLLAESNVPPTQSQVAIARAEAALQQNLDNWNDIKSFEGGIANFWGSVLSNFGITKHRDQAGTTQRGNLLRRAELQLELIQGTIGEQLESIDYEIALKRAQDADSDAINELLNIRKTIRDNANFYARLVSELDTGSGIDTLKVLKILEDTLEPDGTVAGLGAGLSSLLGSTDRLGISTTAEVIKELLEEATTQRELGFLTDTAYFAELSNLRDRAQASITSTSDREKIKALESTVNEIDKQMLGVLDEGMRRRIEIIENTVHGTAAQFAAIDAIFAEYVNKVTYNDAWGPDIARRLQEEAAQGAATEKERLLRKRIQILEFNEGIARSDQARFIIGKQIIEAQRDLVGFLSSIGEVEGNDEALLSLLQRQADNRLLDEKIQIEDTRLRVLSGSAALNEVAAIRANIAVLDKQISFARGDGQLTLKLQLDRRKELASLQQLETETRAAFFLFHAGTANQLASAAAEEKSAFERLEDAEQNSGAKSLAAYNARIALAQAQKRTGELMLELANIENQLAGDLTDPVQSALISLQDITNKLAVPGLGEFETKSLLLEKVQAESQLLGAQVNDALGDLGFAFDMGQIGMASFIKSLRAMAASIDTSTKQGEDLWRNIQLKIKGLIDATDLAFNIPTNIKLPTLFEVRRALQADQMSANYIDSRTQNIDIRVDVSGVDNFDALMRSIENALGSNIGFQARRSPRGEQLVTLGGFG